MITSVLFLVTAGIASQEEPIASSVRGIIGHTSFVAATAGIRTKPDQSITAPIVARVLDTSEAPDGQTRYRIAFIGAVAGDHDLRGLLEREDGSPLDLPPLIVRVVSQLEGNQTTDLFSDLEAPLLTRSQYHAFLWTFGGAWAAMPFVYAGLRVLRRRPAPPAPPPKRPPTLADQLRPLVESARRGGLSVSDRGRLELLLYLYWRERLRLTGSQRDVVPALRGHETAGILLTAVERWLHAPSGDVTKDELSDLLRPYAESPPIADPFERGGAT